MTLPSSDSHSVATTELFIFVPDMIILLYSIRMGEIFYLYRSGESWEAGNSLSGQNQHGAGKFETSDSMLQRCTNISGGVFTPDDIRTNQESKLHLCFYTCTCINIEPLVLYTASWSLCILHGYEGQFSLDKWVWWRAAERFCCKYSLHSPWATTLRSSCSVHARTCSSHSFM